MNEIIETFKENFRESEAQIKARFDNIESSITELAQKSQTALVGSSGFGRVKSLGEQVAAQISQDSEILQKSGRLKFEISTKAAGDI